MYNDLEITESSENDINNWDSDIHQSIVINAVIDIYDICNLLIYKFKLLSNSYINMFFSIILLN